MPRLSEEQLEEYYREALDAHGQYPDGTINVAGHTYTVSQILKAVDAIAYKEGMLAYADVLLGDGYEIEGF